MNNASNGQTHRTHETPIYDSIRRRVGEIEAQHSDPNWIISAEKLREAFGLGDRASIRWQLFKRLEASCCVYGRPAEKIIRETAKRSNGKTNRDRWFCYVVVRELAGADVLADTGDVLS